MARMVIVHDSGLYPALLTPFRIDGCRELLLPVSFRFSVSLVWPSIIILCIIAKQLL